MGLQWDETLSVGNKLIDAQHQELFRRIDLLMEACKRGEGRQELGKVLTFLESYVHEHFSTEERAMARHEYPGMFRHKEEHKEFKRDLEGLKQSIGQEGAGLEAVVKANKWLVTWLIAHIGKSDKALAAYIGK